jgi:hypothetical protein
VRGIGIEIETGAGAGTDRDRDRGNKRDRAYRQAVAAGGVCCVLCAVCCVGRAWTGVLQQGGAGDAYTRTRRERERERDSAGRP